MILVETGITYNKQHITLLFPAVSKWLHAQMSVNTQLYISRIKRD